MVVEDQARKKDSKKECLRTLKTSRVPRCMYVMVAAWLYTYRV